MKLVLCKAEPVWPSPHEIAIRTGVVALCPGPGLLGEIQAAPGYQNWALWWGGVVYELHIFMFFWL